MNAFENISNNICEERYEDKGEDIDTSEDIFAQLQSEKAYSCKYCWETFSNSSNCKVHEATHKRERQNQHININSTYTDSTHSVISNEISNKDIKNSKASCNQLNKSINSTTVDVIQNVNRYSYMFCYNNYLCSQVIN